MARRDIPSTFPRPSNPSLMPSPITVSAPFWFTRPWATDRKPLRVCTIRGLDHSSLNGLDTSEGGARVDASIAHLVAKLNLLGATTLFCCSGLKADHQSPIRPSEAYILFADPVQSIGQLADCLPPPLGWTDPTRLAAMLKATDKALAAAWHTFEQRVDAMLTRYSITWTLAPSA